MTFAPLDNVLLKVAVDRLAKGRLTAIRQQALARFLDSGLPTTREENWKYTNLAPVAEIGNRWLRELSSAAGAAAEHALDSAPLRKSVDAHWLEWRDGMIDGDSLAALQGALGDRVIVSRLSDCSAIPEIDTGDPLSSLNAALMVDALRIRIAEDTVLDKPIGFLLRNHATVGKLSSQSRILIELAPGATAEFVEAHQSGGDGDHFANLVTELELSPNAGARYVKIQDCDERHMQIGRLLARLDVDSTFEHCSVDVGGGLVRNDVVLTLLGAGARASSSGIYLAHGKQHIDNHIHADHRVGPATSRQIYRGIAAGRSRCVFNGKATVHEGADGTDAEQSNNNLLLSDRAEIDTKPELEIYADDVKCSHGATIGQLDKQAVFYLRSRGLDRDQAAQVLTRAFANRIVSDIPVAAVKSHVEQMIDRKLDVLVEEENQ